MPKFVFFGTPEIAVTALEALITSDLTPTLIVTGPAKPQGRGMHLIATPVAIFAETHGIPYLCPVKITPEFIAELTAKGSWDCFIVVAYGKILPQALLDLVDGKVINIHPSLLPKYRGPSPLESVLLSDDTETGVTVMQIDALVDHGPIIAQESFPLPPEMERQQLETLSAQRGAALIAEHLRAYLSGMPLVDQDHAAATHTKKLSKEDGNLDLAPDDWGKWKQYRALAGRPGVYFTVARRGLHIRVKVVRAHWLQGSFVIDEVIPENQKRQSYQTFLQWLSS
jgi:methionyl-tRNA formyltransferase